MSLYIYSSAPLRDCVSIPRAPWWIIPAVAIVSNQIVHIIHVFGAPGVDVLRGRGRHVGDGIDKMSFVSASRIQGNYSGLISYRSTTEDLFS